MVPGPDLNGATSIITDNLRSKKASATEVLPYDISFPDSSHHPVPTNSRFHGQDGKIAKRMRDKERRQRKRRNPVQVMQHRQKLVQNHVKNAKPMKMANDLEGSKRSNGGYLGASLSRRKAPTLQQLVELGFFIKRYDG
jgi:hypothetical protein